MKKAKCVTIDASLVIEVEEVAARLGTTFSALVEEALRRLLRQAETGIEEKLANIEALLRQCLQKETWPVESRGQSSRQELPPQLGGNAWVEILRRRG